jgi:hypothetical protein
MRTRQEGAHLGRHHHELRAAAEHPHGGVPQQAEAGARHRVRGGVARRQAVFADAAQGEVLGGHPLEEGDGLVDLVLRQRRRARPVAAPGVLDPGAHVGPVAHRDGDVGIDALQPLEQAFPRSRVVDPVDVHVDEALALHLGLDERGGFAHEPRERAGGVPFDRENGMRHENRLVALVDDLGQGRVEQERHVVVDDLDHRHVAAPAGALDLEIDEAQVRSAACPRRLEVAVGRHRELGERLMGVRGKVLGRDAPEQVDDEARRHRGPARLEDGRGLGGQGAAVRRHVEFHARSSPKSWLPPRRSSAPDGHDAVAQERRRHPAGAPAEVRTCAAP